ncbi:CheY-like superfamily [Mycena maculata]|uniref:CheY-like superfamily n=1 Tax=Mycena maculata TaxID=230809 RepID=A0AAD7KHL6_9AGAR|nr:CheY-like superfamily [Mycena maculata]
MNNFAPLETNLANPALVSDAKYDILLVENNYVIQRIVLMILTECGHSIELAEDGILGLDAFKDRALQNKPFDVIFMKVSMLLMDGMEAVQCIRAYEMQYELSPTPIIAFLGYSTIADRELWHQAGIDYILTHPIRPVDLLDAISRVITEAGVVL